MTAPVVAVLAARKAGQSASFALTADGRVLCDLPGSETASTGRDFSTAGLDTRLAALRSAATGKGWEVTAP